MGLDQNNSERLAFTGNLRDLVAAGHRYPTIYADPPWPYRNRAARGAAVNHYPVMSLDQICAEPVNLLASPDAHLHLWTTNGFLREAFTVIDAWGFNYKSCFMWIKPQLGAGNYWRVGHEFLLFATRGKQPFRSHSQRSWQIHPRTEHSSKPAEIRNLIETVSPGPYLELFGREAFLLSDWTVYGNQISLSLF